MEPLVIDSEMVPKFVEHGRADLRTELVIGETERHVRLIEDRDLIGRHGVVVDAALGERHSLVETEQCLSAGILVWSRTTLDNEDDVVDA